MKKTLILLFFLCCFVGCGYKTSKEKKIEITRRILKGDQKAIEERNEIMKKIEKNAKTDPEAANELKEWIEVIETFK